ncbi:flagellar biosynthetic protein FliO [Leeia sp. TBRC 13508]|uniref:Flagellar protein n=1 Tax=Leeia speluncae TaxID=2884804 RepID=A0ABS8D5X9_9NEIS|nr:flagellar biosynthetic protein FliO [Leeia speluncae]MCB6183572.1 flagellar biosynthetic protein FliO [Leeia speluncae]
MRLTKQVLSGALISAPLVLLAAPTSASASPLSFGYFFQVIFSLVFVIALVLGAVWAMKRLSLGVPGMKTPVKLIGGTMLGGKERVVVIEVEGEWLVLGVTAQNITVLKQLDKPPVSDAESTMVAPKFKQWLQVALQKYKQNK